MVKILIISVNTKSRYQRHGHGPEAGGWGGGRWDRVPGRGVPRNPLVTGWPGKPRGYSVSAKVRFKCSPFLGERESSHLIELAQHFQTDFTLHTT